MRFLFLFIFSFLTSAGAFAQSICGGLFADALAPSIVTQEISVLASKKLLTADNTSNHSANIERLGLELFNRNHATIIQKSRRSLLRESGGRLEFLDKALNFENLQQELKSGEITFLVKSEKYHKSSALHIFEARFLRGKEDILSFDFRTNGLVAFIHASHRFRGDKLLDYEAVALSGSSILSASVARIVFDSLGENITLSRSMNSIEREIWINGDSHQLGSRNYSQRIHFALNHYYFNNMPYTVQVPKVLLERLFEEKKLEINSYETVEDLSIGMTPLARTPFGLEIEFVITKEASQELMPYFSPALRQGVLNFGR